MICEMKCLCYRIKCVRSQGGGVGPSVRKCEKGEGGGGGVKILQKSVRSYLNAPLGSCRHLVPLLGLEVT